MKLIEFDTDGELSQKALGEALKRLEQEPHDGYADLIVHPARLRTAMVLAAGNNAGFPNLHVRVLAETRMGIDDWKLRSSGVELRVQRA